MSLLVAMRRTVTGAKILNDWLGEGADPVPQEVSNARAAVCVTCPENVEPKWWDRVTGDLAAWMRKTLAIKNDIGYSAAREDDLHMCKKCGCCLPLKVHVPIEHIKAHTTDFSEYPDFCWQRKESNP